ncbi:MAG: hypothetical protein ACE5HU_10530, partial [Acidobacteriota bacterium]
VLAITRRRIRDAKIDHHELPVWRDIDTPSDARALLETLRHRVAKGKPDIPERTFHLLARLIPGRL